MLVNKVIFIQSGCMTRALTHSIFRDKKEVADYPFFQSFNTEVMDLIIPNEVQLVFTSEVSGKRASDVARAIKAKNPSAIVIALTLNQVAEETDLDAIIYKNEDGWDTEVRRLIEFSEGMDEFVSKVKKHISK